MGSLVKVKDNINFVIILNALGILHSASYHTDDKFSTSPHRTSESSLCKMLSNVKSHKFI